MYLDISGFFKDPHPDETLKYEKAIQKHQEEAILAILGWSSLDEGSNGLYELTQDETDRVSELLGDSHIKQLSLFICTRD